MATVSGEWYFEEYLDFPSDIFDNVITVNFEVVNNDWRDSIHIIGFVYDKINEDKNTLCYLVEDSLHSGLGYHQVYRKGESWDPQVNYSYRHIDFGNVEQEVPDIFYAWLLENATPVSDSDVSQTIWTDYCVLKTSAGGVSSGFLVPEDQLILQKVSGTVADFQFTEVKCGVTKITDLGSKKLELIFLNKAGDQWSIFQGYSNNQEPYDGGAILIKFKPDQEVSQAFYDWFKDNTVIYSQNTPLVGVWQLGNTLAIPDASSDVEYDILIQDSDGVTYTKWKTTITDMGDVKYMFYRSDTAEWVAAFYISF